MSAQQETLILVHPGSACGSADFNLGSGRAGAEVRSNLIRELLGWNGNLLVLHGELSGELKYYPDLNRAIDSSLHRRELDRSVALELFPGDDFAEAAVNLLSESKTIGSDESIVVSGAWRHGDDIGGCVNHVFNTLKQSGFANVRISEAAAMLDPEPCPAA